MVPEHLGGPSGEDIPREQGGYMHTPHATPLESVSPPPSRGPWALGPTQPIGLVPMAPKGVADWGGAAPWANQPIGLVPMAQQGANTVAKKARRGGEYFPLFP